MKVYEERFLTIEVDQEKKCLVQHWKGTVRSDEYRRGQEKTVEVFNQYGLKNLVSNTKEAGALKTEDTDWAAQNIVPKLTSRGLRTLNMVVPSSVFTKLTLQDIEKKTKSVLQVKYFDDVRKAILSL